MNPEKQVRAVVIGSVKQENNTMKQVIYTDASGDEQTKWIPNACIVSTEEIDGQSVMFLQDATVNSVQVSVADMYGFSTDHAQMQDMADAWIEFGEVTPFSLDAVELQREGEEVQMEFASKDDTVEMFDLTLDDDIDDEESDDSTPQFDTASFDLSAFVEEEEEAVDDEAVKQAKKKQKAIDKVALAREKRKADSDKVKATLNDPISKAMADGKRHDDFGAWNFEAKTYELAMIDYGPNGEKTIIPVRTSNGDARMRTVVNPTLADEDNPLGVVLNRAVGNNFEVIDHPTVFKPVIEQINAVNEAAGQELISWSAFSINKGSRAVMNIDITGYATKTRIDSAKSLSNYNYVNLSANRIYDALVEEHGGHRMGVTILNSHDGKSALQAFMTVLRTYCGNLAMRGGVQNLLMYGNSTKVRHMKGSVGQFDAHDWAERVVGALAENQKNLLAMSILRHIPKEIINFDSMLTVFNKHGLLPQPTVKVAAGDKNQFDVDEQGNVVMTTASLGKDAARVLGGHAYNAAVKGWVDPDVHYVAATTKSGAPQRDEDSIGTMWHVAQVGSGMITHNPMYSDGKRTLHGKKQGVETFMNRSGTMTSLFEDIAFRAVNKYAEHTGQPVDDLQAMEQWYAENPHMLEVPYSDTVKGTKKMKPITEVPSFQETWKVKIVEETVKTK